MAWTTIQATASDIDEEIASFAGESSVSSIDSHSLTSIGSNRVVALIEYTTA